MDYRDGVCESMGFSLVHRRGSAPFLGDSDRVNLDLRNDGSLIFQLRFLRQIGCVPLICDNQPPDLMPCEDHFLNIRPSR